MPDWPVAAAQPVGRWPSCPLRWSGPCPGTGLCLLFFALLVSARSTPLTMPCTACSLSFRLGVPFARSPLLLGTMAECPTRMDHVLVTSPGHLLSQRLARLHNVNTEAYELVGSQVKGLAPWLAPQVDDLRGRTADSFERWRLVQAGDIDPCTSRVKLGKAWRPRLAWPDPIVRSPDCPIGQSPSMLSPPSQCRRRTCRPCPCALPTWMTPCQRRLGARRACSPPAQRSCRILRLGMPSRTTQAACARLTSPRRTRHVVIGAGAADWRVWEGATQPCRPIGRSPDRQHGLGAWETLNPLYV